MEAHILNAVIERDIPDPPPPLSLPSSTDFSHSSSSSHISKSTLSSVSRSTSASSSSSKSSPTSESTSFSLASPTITPPSSESSLSVTPTYTVTAIAGSTSPSSSSVAGAPPRGFLQNKVLSGVVFGIAGLVGFVLLILFATFVIRRRRNKRLFEEALSFDPVKMGNYHHALESGQGESIRASVSTGHASYGPEVRQSPAFIDYAPPTNRSYHPAESFNTPSYAPPSKGQYNTTSGQPYASPYGPQQNSSLSISSRGRS